MSPVLGLNEEVTAPSFLVFNRRATTAMKCLARKYSKYSIAHEVNDEKSLSVDRTGVLCSYFRVG